ncbi:MAG: DNA topoisomerase [Daejeonella sp.]
MITVIAEKPSVAKDLAKVLGATKFEDGCIKNDKYAFTWAFGHLVQLAMPDEYGLGNWSDVSQLPVIPEKFKLILKQVKQGKSFVDDPGVKKQMKVIENLFNQSEYIVVATDAGREGELIFRYIYQYLNCKVPFQRLWISSQTNEAILNGFNTLKPGVDYDTLFEAARCRNEADWLIGINATRALSSSLNSNKTLSIGRVQTPTLAMIAQRYEENINFKPKDYFQLKLSFLKDNINFYALGVDDHSEKNKADELLKKILSKGSVIIDKVEKKEKKENAPLLYDLTALQRDASRKLNFNPDKTLEVAQSLYEGKMITYPRTGSAYIGEDVFKLIPELLQNVSSKAKFSQVASPLLGSDLNKRSVNDVKVTDHHALLPTNTTSSDDHLSKDQQSLYEMIVFRFLEAFYPPCVKSVTSVKLSSEGVEFATSATLIKIPGWRNVLGEAEEVNPDGPEVNSLPELQEGESLPIHKGDVLSKKTKPKPLLTMDTLLELMETCGKKIDDEAAKEAMKDLGLGTPATRAGIIKILFDREYTTIINKKSIVPTVLGLSVYNLVKDKPVSNAILTGQWEQKLEEIRAGKFPANGFMRGIYDYTKLITGDLLSIGSSSAKSLNEAINSQKTGCPKCKKGYIFQQPKFAGCTEFKDSKCDFKIWKTIAGKAISESQVNNLIEKGKTATIKGFMSKAGKTFDAALKLTDSFAIEFVFEQKGSNSGVGGAKKIQIKK